SCRTAGRSIAARVFDRMGGFVDQMVWVDCQASPNRISIVITMIPRIRIKQVHPAECQFVLNGTRGEGLWRRGLQAGSVYALAVTIHQWTPSLSRVQLRSAANGVRLKRLHMDLLSRDRLGNCNPGYATPVPEMSVGFDHMVRYIVPDPEVRNGSRVRLTTCA